MANRQWGFLCPEDGGLLVERPEWNAQGVIWCPNAGHGGNGRMFRQQEVKEGWYDPTRPVQSEEWQAREVERRAHAEEIANHRLAVEEANRQKERRRMADTTAKTKAPKVGQPCLCGCGETTKGGRFIPGHDARYHSRIRQLEAQGVSHDDAAKIASKGPLTGKYAAAAQAAKTAKAPAAKTASTEAPVTAVPKPSAKGKRSKPAPAPESEPTADEPATADIEV